MIYLQLFLSFLQVGLFSFGGGYAAIPLIQSQVTEINPWLSSAEFVDLITISQMTPGPIALNSATFVGLRIAGLGGAAVATLGCILPSCLIVSFLAWLYTHYQKAAVVQHILAALRPAVVALIAASGLSMLIFSFWGEKGISLSSGSLDMVSVLIFTVAITLLRKFKLNPIIVMTISGLLGLSKLFF